MEASVVVEDVALRVRSTDGMKVHCILFVESLRDTALW